MLTIDRASAAIVLLAIDRPPANALTHDLIQKLLDTFVQLREDADCPAVILTGEGPRFFSAGGDIREVATNQAVAVPRMRTFHRMLIELENYGPPVVCAVNGYAAGAGLELVLHADYVVASDGAHFGFPEINHGLLPAAKGIRQAVNRLGRRVTEQMLYSGAFLSADKALSVGLVDEVVSAAELQDRALARAGELRKKDVHLFSTIKKTLNAAQLMNNDELEERTISDMIDYLSRAETAAARENFLRRKEK